VALDSALSEAWSAVGRVRQHRGDWDGAGEAYRRAVALDPRDAEARYWYATHLTVLRRLDEARAQLRQAVALDPYAINIRVELVTALFSAGDSAGAIRQFEEVRARHPDAPVTHLWGAFSYLAVHDFDRMAFHLERYLTAMGADPESIRALADSIRPPDLRRAALRNMADTARGALTVVAVLRSLGEDDAAVAYLARVADSPAAAPHAYLSGLVWALGMPPSLLSDPRVDSALTKLMAPSAP
jgi:tetratricopeptide (TPR) repeat protein